VSAATVAAAPGIVTVARTTTEVEELRTLWAAAGPRNLDSDLDHLLGQVAAMPGARPHVLCVDAPGRDPVLVIARQVQDSYRWRIGYRTIARLSAPTIVVSFDGVIGDADEDGCSLAVQELRRQLLSGEAAAVLFQKVDVDSPLRRALDRSAPGLLRSNGQPVVRRTLALPDSWESFLAQRSSKSRRQLRYDDNKVRRTFGERMVLRRYTPDDPDPHVVRDMAVVAARSYQHGLGVDGIVDGVGSELISLARQHGWLRVWMLYIDDQPVSFWWGTVYAGTLSTGSPGYLPELAKDRVGYFTLRRMIEDACADPTIRVLDFGHGDADYKERFATEATMTADTTLFAPRPRAFAIRLLTGLASGTAALTRVAAGTRRGQQVKRWLRGRAADRAASTAGEEQAP
jgi:CelD/BcsL family acetyltransferase involved in cellulose biosynthesis